MADPSDDGRQQQQSNDPSGAAGHERPKRDSSNDWKTSWWTEDIEEALLEAAKTKDRWGCPHGGGNAMWRGLLAEFDSDPRLPSTYKGKLKKMTADAKLNALLDLFERTDMHNCGATGLGDEEFGSRQQLLLDCCTLRNDAAVKSAQSSRDKKKKQEEMERLNKIGQALRQAAYRAHRHEEEEEGDQSSGTRGSGAAAEETPESRDVSPGPRAMVAQCLKFLTDSAASREEMQEHFKRKHTEEVESRKARDLLESRRLDMAENELKERSEERKALMQLMRDMVNVRNNSNN